MGPGGTRPVSIRDVGPDELDEAAAVGLAAYEEYAALMGPDAWAGYAENIRDVRSRLPESELIVAEADGKLVGAVTFYPTYKERVNVGWPSDWTGIRLVAVRPESRGRGTGRMLVEECVRRSRDQGAAAVGLHTTPLMHVAAAMYRRIGFVRAPEHDIHPSPDFTVTAYRLALS